MKTFAVEQNLHVLDHRMHSELHAVQFHFRHLEEVEFSHDVRSVQEQLERRDYTPLVLAEALKCAKQ